MLNEVLHFITNASFEDTNKFLTSVLSTSTLPSRAINDKYIVNEDLDSNLKELKNEICQYGGRDAEISTLIFRLLQEPRHKILSYLHKVQ